VVLEGDAQLSKTIAIPDRPQLTIIMGGGTVDLGGGNVTAFSQDPPAEDTAQPMAELQQGATTVTLPSADNVKPGDTLRFNSADQIMETRPYYTYGEMRSVKSVAGNTVTLDAPLKFNYRTKVAVARRPPMRRLVVSGTHQIVNGGQQSGGWLIQHSSGEISGVTIVRGVKERGIALQQCSNFKIHDNHIEGIVYPKSGTSYGVVIAGACEHITVSHNQLADCRHLVALGEGPTPLTAGITDLVTIEDNDLKDGPEPDIRQMIDSHGNGYRYYVKNNRFTIGYKYALNSRARETYFQNNQVTIVPPGNNTSVVYIYGGKLHDPGEDAAPGFLEVSGNTVENTSGKDSVFLMSLAVGASQKEGEATVVKVHNNTLKDIGKPILVGSDARLKIEFQHNIWTDSIPDANMLVRNTMAPGSEIDLLGNTITGPKDVITLVGAAPVLLISSNKMEKVRGPIVWFVNGDARDKTQLKIMSNEIDGVTETRPEKYTQPR
jgi:hypothetical protein